MRLSKRYATALVTGAGSGVGAAFTSMLLDEGVRVWGTAREPSKLTERTGFSTLALELSDAESVSSVWAAAERDSGGIDLLINNGGGGLFGQFAATPADLWERQLDVLLHGPVRLARLAFGAMQSRGRGCVVNISSMVVQFPTPLMSSYNAGKAALSAWSDSLALEAAGSGLLIVDFRLGDYRTNFNQAMTKLGEDAMDQDQKRVMQRLDTLLERAPPPAHAARRLRSVLRRGTAGTVCVGSFGQTRLAPFLERFVPRAVSRFVRRRYYRLP